MKWTATWSGCWQTRRAVALDNAQWTLGLEQKVKERTEELDARVDELAILNSVGEAMAKTMDVKTVAGIVGEKVRDIFQAEGVSIMLYDPQTNLIHSLYEYDVAEDGMVYIEPFPLGKGLTSRVIETRQPILIGTITDQEAKGAYIPPESAQKSPSLIAESEMLVPIQVGEKVLGVVLVAKYRQNAFNQDDLRLLQTLSTNMGVAIENARLFQSEQQRNAELAVINSIQQGLASELNFQAIVELVGDKLRDVLATPDLYIKWYEENTNRVHYLYCYEHGERLTIPARLLDADSITDRILKTRQPLVWNTLEEGDKLSPVIPGTDASKSGLSVPIISSDRILGVVQVENYERENAYGDSELRLLSTVTASLGAALENARLFDETQRLLKETEQRNAELAVINSIQQGLAAELNFQAIIDLVGDKLRQVFNTQDLSIDWLDEANNQILFLYSYEHGKRLTLAPMPFSKSSILPRLIKTHLPLVCNTSAEMMQVSTTIPGTDISKSSICVPIISGEKVLGQILLENYEQEYAFSESDVRLLTTVTASLGVALQNARLFDETQRLLKETEQRAAELAVINSIQQGLAAELNFQAIIDLVGDKLREVLHTGEIGIRWLDTQTNMIHYLYEYEHGKRLSIPPGSPESLLWKILIETRQPYCLNSRAAMEKTGIKVVPGTDQSFSMLEVPIIGSDRVIGAIITEDYERENAYGESEIRLLQTIASSMGVALENARLFSETERLLTETEQRASELAVINSIQQGLAVELNFQAIVDLVGDKLKEVLDTDDLSIAWYEEKTNLIHHLYFYEHGKRLTLPPQPPQSGAIFDRLVKTRQPVVWNTEAEGDAISPVIPGTDSSKAGVALPIISGDRILGRIQVENYEQENAYGEAELRLLTTITGSLGAALQNARLFDETERLLKETEQRAAELSVINSVQAGLAAELNIQGIYDTVGDKIREIFHNSDLGIRIYDPVTKLEHFPYTFENGKRIHVDPMLVSEKGFSAHVIRTRQTLVINKNMLEEVEKYGSYILPGTVAEKSTVFVPLVVGDQARGLINLANMEREDAFSESDVRLLETVANSMSVALENARLFDETQRLLKETEQRAAELAVINSIQQGLAAEMNFQAIIDLVGDKLREVLHTGEIGIRWYDTQENMIHYLYEYEHGKRISIPAGHPYSPLWLKMYEKRRPYTLNSREEMANAGMKIVPGTDQSMSMVEVPIIGSDRVIGSIISENYEREHAYGEAEIRLLQTIASSMGVALENARLFSETERLLNETEQRAAELSVINSVQEGLASKLDKLAIFELIGEKTREVFNIQVVDIVIHDETTNLLTMPYSYEKGDRSVFTPREPYGFRKQVLENGAPILINNNFRKLAEQSGNPILTGDCPKSVLFVPIMLGTKAKGVVSIQDLARENAFTDADMHLLQTLSSSMSVALENARLFDETQALLKETEQRNRELAILNDISAAISRTLDVKELTHIVGDKVREVFKSDSAIIMLLDKETQLIHIPYEYDRNEGGYIDYVEPFPLGTGLSSKVILTGEPLLMSTLDEEIANGAYFPPEIIAKGSGFYSESWLGVPIKVKDQVLGLLALSDARPYAFNESYLRLMQTLSSNVGVALENARLFNETQRLLKETEQRAAELATVNTLSQALASATELAMLIELTGEQMKRTFAADIIYVALLDQQTNMIHFPYSYGEEMPSLPLGSGLTSKILQSGEPLLINKDMTTQRAALGVKLTGTEALSFVGVPIISNKQPIGVISVQSIHQEGLFTEDDMHLLTTLASNVGVAIEKARLYEETQRRAREAAAIAEVGREISATLDQKVVMDRIASRAFDLLKGDLAAVYLISEDGGTLRAIAAVGKNANQILEDHPELGVGIIGTNAQLGKAELITDAEHDPRARHVPGTPYGDVPERMMVAPLLAGDKVTGMMATWREGGRSSPRSNWNSWSVYPGRQPLPSRMHASSLKARMPARKPRLPMPPRAPSWQ